MLKRASKKYFLILVAFCNIFLLLLTSHISKGGTIQKSRLIVLTDIEADPDDTQSLVRLLLYSNEIDIEGIVATTSCWMTDKIYLQSIKNVIKAYEKIQPNLLIHHPEYPKAELLYPLVKEGLPKYGMTGVGEGMDSEGSDWIIKTLEKEDERPLWISVWGGANTLAQALYKLEKTKSKKEAKRLISKLRVYTISDQDNSGLWIREKFPDLFYIVSPGHVSNATWKGISASDVEGMDPTTISNGWIAQNIQQGHGPLGASYPDVAWTVEGDTPAFLSLILNGLNSPENPNWGGWGGRYEFYRPEAFKEGYHSLVENKPETRKIWTNATDTYTPYIPNEYGRSMIKSSQKFTGFKLSIWRWRDDFQNDFAARMDWCEMSFEEANHNPIVILSHPEEITVKSGETFTLDAFDTVDPDGDSFSFFWFNYPEAGNCKKRVNVHGSVIAHKAKYIAPKVDEEQTAHIILRVTDKGTPRLSSYKRVIVIIKPD